MLLRLGTVPTLVVSSPHAAQQVLRTHDTSFALWPRSVISDILSYGLSDVGLAPYGSQEAGHHTPARREEGAVLPRRPRGGGNSSSRSPAIHCLIN
jgi:hypothetical protein